MPLYEYICRNCGAELELLLRGQERPSCQACGSDNLEKLLSVTSAHSAGGRSAGPDLPEGPCGSACGCFPQ